MERERRRESEKERYREEEGGRDRQRDSFSLKTLLFLANKVDPTVISSCTHRGWFGRTHLSPRRAAGS